MDLVLHVDNPTALKCGCRSVPLKTEGRQDSVGPLWCEEVLRKLGGQVGFVLEAVEGGHGATCSRSL